MFFTRVVEEIEKVFTGGIQVSYQGYLGLGLSSARVYQSAPLQ